MQVGIKEAQRRMDEILEAVQRGEEVILTRWKKPVAQMVYPDVVDATFAPDLEKSF